MLKAMLLIVIISCLGACANQSVETLLPDGSIVCSEPRPQICTREYRPVCGYTLNGDSGGEQNSYSEKTYATGCTACAHPEVKAYRPQACEITQ